MIDPATDRIVVAGAGSVGCFVGGLLIRGGRDVVLLGRDRIMSALRAEGLRLTDLDGRDARIAPTELRATVDPGALADADVILVTVKSRATREMGALIREHARPRAVIVSLQNGVTNADALRAELPGRVVLAGMVPFNVLQDGGRFHRGTSGDIRIESGAPGLADLLSVDGLTTREAPDLRGILWGKLLLNLNNALNALSGLPLRQQLQSRAWRRVLAAQQAEALALLRRAGIRPENPGPMPPAWLPHILRLPTPLFRIVAAGSLRIDAEARSSMWEDLERRRPTEAGELQGAVLALAEELGATAPVNARAADLIQQAEAAGKGSPHLSPSVFQE